MENHRPPELVPLAQFAIQCLKAERIRYVFGIPGGLLHPFFAAVEQDPELKLVVTKHECGAAFMADGFARACGQMAVAAATSGPGATNLITGVAVAYTDGIPMLVITGQAPSGVLGKGAAQETAPEDVDIVSMFRPITKYSAMVRSPEAFAHHFQRALRMASSGRPGPVHLNIPVDFWRQPVLSSCPEPATYRSVSRPFDRQEVERASGALLQAESPVFLVGSGAAEAVKDVVTTAELLSARVATTPRAKGLFPEDHPLSLGVFGFAGQDSAKRVLLGDKPDLLFTIGASLNETTTFNWNPHLGAGRTFIQLDIDGGRIGRNYPVDIALVGDAQAIMGELSKRMRQALADGVRPQSSWEDERGRRSPHLAPVRGELARRPRGKRKGRLVSPEAWRAELNSALPDNAIVISDIGGHMLFNIHHLRIRKQQRFLLNFNFGSMGHGTAAAIGVALAQRDRPVVAIIGDGCFHMNGMEILTAREYDVPVVWIVENNQRHGITWHGSQVVDKGRPMECIVFQQPVAIAEVAEAMGLRAWRVEQARELGPVLREAIGMRHPAVIEIAVDPDVAPPLADRAKTVAGFKS